VKLGVQVGLLPGHTVLDGDPAPPKGRSPPPTIFGPYLLRPNGSINQDATWYGGRPPPRRLCVRLGPTPPSQKKGAEPPPQFSAHVYCGQTAGWIKIVLGTEVGLIPGDLVVLDGDPAPSQKGVRTPSPIFGQFLLWPSGWMHQDATWYGGRPPPTGLCVRCGHSPSPKRGRSPPNFRPMFIVPKRLDASRCHLVWW